VRTVRKAVGSERARIKSAFTIIEVDTANGLVLLAVPNGSVTLVAATLAAAT
jgi:hypothetical protein